ncbi:MAG: hypothetical protein EYC69_08970 [Bacteroidetes bacterium]|nr:MAG: hypothetical protein EYC69_08970 [Bacteroidota bacterium]
MQNEHLSHMKLTLTTILFSIFSILSSAQFPYTQNSYSSALTNSDIVYGIDTNFAAQPDTLLLDIYKPIGDSNCQKPILILVHGGSWIAGSKNDPNIEFLAEDFAKKGYVVAAINYRLGMHVISNYSMYWACNTSISAPCAYITDSSEIIRAIYRGMQDTKAAVRFMKGRAQVDSTDINNVYLAGESAGGFIVLAAAYLRDEVQKPADCFSLNPSATPDPDLLTCLPDSFSLDRPDLGSIDGDLNVQSGNSKIKGVANFYGGMLDLSLLNNSTDKPAIYQFHQGSDVVVDYQYNRILGRINWECFAPTNVCQPYPNMPFAYGSKSIYNHLVAMGSQSPLYLTEIVSNYNYMNDCFANGHSIDNVTMRSSNLAAFFSGVILSSGNNPPMNCSLISVPEISQKDFSIYPVPARDRISINYSSSIHLEKIIWKDVVGKEIGLEIINGRIAEILSPANAVSGLYFLELHCREGKVTKKIFIGR